MDVSEAIDYPTDAATYLDNGEFLEADALPLADAPLPTGHYLSNEVCSCVVRYIVVVVNGVVVVFAADGV